MNNQKLINFNKKVHEKVNLDYNSKHEGDIFSLLEQERLFNTLKKAASHIVKGDIIAIDLGAGTGNLTNHLLKFAKTVVAADISKKFLNQIEQEYRDKITSKKLETLMINGKDLSNIDDNSFTLVSVYSVLHHIPDYLEFVSEMIRITKPGGIIFIDHEVNENYWNPSNDYIEFINNTNNNKPMIIDKYRYFKIKRYLNKLYFIFHKFEFSKKFPITSPFNPRYQPNGDLHVWKEDHIEWDKIKNLFSFNNCMVLYEANYLLYKNHYPLDLYDNYRSLCNDYKCVFAKKN